MSRASKEMGSPSIEMGGFCIYIDTATLPTGNGGEVSVLATSYRALPSDSLSLAMLPLVEVDPDAFGTNGHFPRVKLENMVVLGNAVTREESTVGALELRGLTRGFVEKQGYLPLTERQLVTDMTDEGALEVFTKDVVVGRIHPFTIRRHRHWVHRVNPGIHEVNPEESEELLDDSWSREHIPYVRKRFMPTLEDLGKSSGLEQLNISSVTGEYLPISTYEEEGLKQYEDEMNGLSQKRESK